MASKLTNPTTMVGGQRVTTKKKTTPEAATGQRTNIPTNSGFQKYYTLTTSGIEIFSEIALLCPHYTPEDRLMGWASGSARLFLSLYNPSDFRFHNNLSGASSLIYFILIYVLPTLIVLVLIIYKMSCFRPSQNTLKFLSLVQFRCIRTRNIKESTDYIPSIHDPPVIRRPGDIIEPSTLIRNHWAFPGFNSILELPVYTFESYDGVDKLGPQRYVRVPNEIFGIPLRPDILHRCYQFYRRAKAGYYEGMQLYKWEWPGSTKKWRKQQKTGKARIGWKKSPGKYLGVFAHPMLVPYRTHCILEKVSPTSSKRILEVKWEMWDNYYIHQLSYDLQYFTEGMLYIGLKTMLSAKFAQAQIQVVDSFLMKSHKTKYAVKNLRDILGTNCNSALLVFSDYNDSNENFRWSTANIPSVHNEVVEGVNVYNLLKYRQLVITESALNKLIYLIENYPKVCDWLPKYATPDNKPAPLPEKVKGWNNVWVQNKMKSKLLSQTREEWLERVKKWKWSSEVKGALKVPRNDPFENFKLTYINYNNNENIKTRYQYLYDSLFNYADELNTRGDEGDMEDFVEDQERLLTLNDVNELKKSGDGIMFK